VIGCSLEIGKRKVRATGLKVGPITSVPGCTVTERYEDPSRYAQPPNHAHGGEGGNGGHPHGAEHMASLAGSRKRPERPEPSHEFLHPTPDYSYLTRGPRIVAQYPAPSVPIKPGCAVSLTIGN
jgi:hypothetical protein